MHVVGNALRQLLQGHVGPVVYAVIVRLVGGSVNLKSIKFSQPL